MVHDGDVYPGDEPPWVWGMTDRQVEPARPTTSRRPANSLPGMARRAHVAIDVADPEGNEWEVSFG